MQSRRNTGEQPGRLEPFEEVISAFAKDPAVTQSRMFGASGLKVKNRVFAMLVKGSLVVKLPKERVEALVASKKGEYFDPGHGRLMREWVAIEPSHNAQWLNLAREARRFVTAAQGEFGQKRRRR